MKRKKIKAGGYIVASVLLFWAGFPPNGILPALFLCFLPVFRLQDLLSLENRRVRWFMYFLTFSLWHLTTVWWISHAHPIGLIAPIVLHGGIMATALLWTDKVSRSRPKLRMLAFILAALGYEKLFLSWDLEFPWLLLGNGLAEWTSLAQWYTYTGVFGGSLWILLINVAAYKLLEARESSEKRNWLIGLSIVLLLPAGVSLNMLKQYHKNQSKADSLTATVFQPNIDPYGSKFQASLYQNQLDTFLRYCDTLPAQSQLLIWPETALPGDYDLGFGASNWQNGGVDSFLQRHPNLFWLSGINGFQFFPPNYNSLSARSAGNGSWYEVYNAAILREIGAQNIVYNKRKRVVGVEKTPYLHALAFLKNTSLDLGGMAGNLGDLPYKGLLTPHGIPIVPIICYESVFPDQVAAMTKEGGKLLVIMTNDGWWDDSPGYRQHFLFARLRALENRRWIARSANTGISGFIGPDGQAHEQLPWGVRGMLTRKLPLSNELTFFTKTGDYIGKIASWLFAALFLFSLTPFFKINHDEH